VVLIGSVCLSDARLGITSLPGVCLVARAEFFSRYATARRPNESLSLHLQMAEVRQGQSRAGNAEGAVG
jgi:hypothetical protein